MTEERTRYSEHYRRVREAFDELELESQARFLVEATAATIGRGIDLLAHRVAEDMEEAFGEKGKETEQASEEPESQAEQDEESGPGEDE